jgi:hypothetical protein
MHVHDVAGKSAVYVLYVLNYLHHEAPSSLLTAFMKKIVGLSLYIRNVGS